MAETQDRTETVSLLQDLGLKEYEARCFLALSQVSTATAKEISDVSQVPRTRVYDAVRTLEAQGLVEVHHGNPQQFRAVSVDEATRTLRQKYDSRIETLESYLETIEIHEDSSEDGPLQEVWSLSGKGGIESRTLELVENADSEVVLVVVDESILTDSLVSRLEAALERDVTVILGALDDSVADLLEAELPEAQVFQTELDWLVSHDGDGEVAIGRLQLVDRSKLLVSSFHPNGDGDGEPDEHAVFATGLTNGVVVLIRRLVVSGLMATADPGR